MYHLGKKDSSDTTLGKLQLYFVGVHEADILEMASHMTLLYRLG